MPRLKCLPESIFVETAPDQTILEALLSADIPHTYACGGNARCSTCRVMIMSGVAHCSPATSAERSLAKRLNFPVHVRLACQTRVSGNATIWRMVIDSDDIDVVDSQVNTEFTDNQKFVSALFVSVRGLSDFDEKNFPYDIIYIMSRYFFSLHKFLTDYGAVVSHAGNTTMAIFGMQDSELVVERSVWAGWELLQLVESLNVRLEQLGYRPLQATVGLNCGQALILPTTEKQRTAFGEVVDRASRIEAGNRKVGTKFLISEAVLEQMQDKVAIGKSHNFLFSAKNQEYQVFEVIDVLGQPPEKVDKGMISASFSAKILSFMKRLAGKK